MDKGRVDAMFAQFMEQQGVAQCRIVPNQVFGPRFAAPCASERDLDQARLGAMSELLRKYILPLITDRLQESAALLDVFLGLSAPPSMLQLVRYGRPVRCGSYRSWRQGRRHGMLQECQRTGKGSGANYARDFVTATVRRAVKSVMGYELWLYRNASALLDVHLGLHRVQVTRPQAFTCKPKTLQGCSKKQVTFLSKWQRRPRGELAAEIRRLTESMGKSAAGDMKALRKLASLEGLLDDPAAPMAREDL